MLTFSKQVEIKQERKEKDKVRKEKLAEYFFSLSNTILGSLILGVALLLLENGNEYSWTIVSLVLVFGFIFLVVLAKIGNNILK